jgi:hypothetical protein
MDTNPQYQRIQKIRTLIANTTNPEDKATLLSILSALGDMIDGQKSWDLPDIIGASPTRCDEIFEVGTACLHVTLSR